MRVVSQKRWRNAEYAAENRKDDAGYGGIR